MDGKNSMKAKKNFLQGRFLAPSLCYVGQELFPAGSDFQRTASSEEKLSVLKGLIDENYIGDVDEEALEEGIYKAISRDLKILIPYITTKRRQRISMRRRKGNTVGSVRF